MRGGGGYTVAATTLRAARDVREWDVLGVGDIDVDIFFSVERLPTRDDKVLGSLLGEFSGGMTGNVCCAASRLGARAAMLGAVGDDAKGGKALGGLTEYSVDTSLVRVVKGSRTFFCIVLLDASGEKSLTAVDTDCRLPRREDIDPEAFGRSRLVHIIGDDAGFVLWAAHEAARRGSLVSVDMEARTTERAAKDIERLLAQVDLVFLNEAGYRLGFGGEPLEGVGTLLRLGPRVVVVTCGAHGAFVGTAEGVWKIPAFRVPVVDTTGAGDCFIGAFLTCFLQGNTPLESGHFAAAAAALSVRHVGARTGLPTRRDVLEFLARSVVPQPWKAAQ